MWVGWGGLVCAKLVGCSLLTCIRAGHGDGLWAVGVEDIGIMALLLIAQGKYLCKLGGSKFCRATVGISKSGP